MKVENKKINEDLVKNSTAPVNIFTGELDELTPPNEDLLPEIFYFIGNNSAATIVLNTLHLKNTETPLSIGKNVVVSVEKIAEFDSDIFKEPEDRDDEKKVKWSLRNIRSNPELITFYVEKEMLVTNTMDEMKSKMTKHLTIAEYVKENNIPWNIPFKVRNAFPDYESPVDAELIEEGKQLEKVGNQKRMIIDMSSEMDKSLEDEDEGTL